MKDTSCFSVERGHNETRDNIGKRYAVGVIVGLFFVAASFLVFAQTSGVSHGWGEITGKPAGFADDVDNGLTSESDPTVAASVKDGISWGEISGRPAGLDDGDQVGGGGGGGLQGMPGVEC